MLDTDIRQILLKNLHLIPSMRKVSYVEEWFISRKVIADVVGITSECLTGFEIKSDGDSLTRLANQIVSYDKVCRFNYIVVSDKFKNTIENHIPSHWGIIYVTHDGIEILKEAKDHDITIKSLFWVLWRAEMVECMKQHKLKGYSKLRMSQITAVIIKELDAEIVEQYVYHTLLQRNSWKLQKH